MSLPALPLALALAAAPLTFDQALRLALEAPAVAASRAAVIQRRSLGAEVSSLTANPQVGVQVGGRRHEDEAGPELFASLAQPFNLAGLGGARREALASELEQDRSASRGLELETRLKVARGWLTLWTAQATWAEARQEVALATDWAGRVERAAQAGGLTRADAAAARGWQAEAALDALSAEGEVFSAGVLLNGLLGRSVAEPAVADAALPELPLPDAASLSRSLDHAERAPSVEVLARLRDAEEARLAEVAAANGTWLQLGVHAGREGAGDVVGLGTVQLTLPAFDRGERDQVRLRAAAVRAEGDRQDALARAYAERLDAAHELEHSRELLALVEGALLPAAEDAARFAQRRMEGGEGTALEWVLARRTVLMARSRRLRAQADHTLSRFKAAELAAATQGTP
jgi:outer membrane protein, heavy metal efflux system